MNLSPEAKVVMTRAMNMKPNALARQMNITKRQARACQQFFTLIAMCDARHVAGLDYKAYEARAERVLDEMPRELRNDLRQPLMK